MQMKFAHRLEKMQVKFAQGLKTMQRKLGSFYIFQSRVRGFFGFPLTQEKDSKHGASNTSHRIQCFCNIIFSCFNLDLFTHAKSISPASQNLQFSNLQPQKGCEGLGSRLQRKYPKKISAHTDCCKTDSNCSKVALPVIVVQVAVSYSVLQCPVEGQYLLHPHQPEVWRELRKASSQFLFLEEVEARGERMPVEAIPQLRVVMVFHVEEHPALQRVVTSCDAPLSSVASLSSSAPTLQRLQNRPLDQYCTREHTARDTVVCVRETEVQRDRFAPVGSALEDNEAAAKACVDKAMSVTMALLVITPVLVLSSDCAFDFFRCADAVADPPLEARIGGMPLYRCSNNTLFLVRNGELLLLLLISRKLKRAEEEEHGCRHSRKKLIPDAIVRNLDPRPDCEARRKT
jgi:hypothetical protein